MAQLPTPSTTEMWIKILKDVGFPIVVALWFMLRSDKRQDKILDLLNKIIDNHKD